MGNCVNKPVTWVDDDEWETADETPDYKKTTSTSDDGTTAPTEVKIKISKKQLEKMLQQAAGAGKGKSLQLEQVLMDLVNLGHVVYRAQEQEDASRHWRPKLQSIPEISE